MNNLEPRARIGMTKDELIEVLGGGQIDSQDAMDLLTEYINDKDITAAINKLYE